MTRITTLAVLALTASAALAQDVDTPGIDDGTTLGAVTKASIEAHGGKAHGDHAKDPYGTGPNSGRTGLARIGNDLSDTIDIIDGD